jgi:hypothetical protein
MAFPSPSLPAPALALYELSFRGVAFGGVSPTSPYQLVGGITGGLDMPAVQSGDVQRPLDDGEFGSVDVSQGRDVAIDMLVSTVPGPFQSGPLVLPELTNLVPNPSFNHDTVGGQPAAWSTLLGTVAGAGMSVFYYFPPGGGYSGSNVLEIVTDGTAALEGAGIELVPPPGGFVEGVEYTLSLWMNSPGGVPLYVSLGNGGADTATDSVTLPASGAFSRTLVNWTPTANEPNAYVIVRNQSATAHGWYITAVQVGPGGTPQSYGDGDTAGCRWLGTPGDSASTNLPAPTTTTAITVDQARQQLGAAFKAAGSTEYPLYVQLSTGIYACMVRPRKFNFPFDINTILAEATPVSALLHATDPRWYAAPSKTATVGLPSAPGGGLAVPAPVPWSLGGGSVGGLLDVWNLGTVEMRPVLVFTGPCTNPAAANLSIAGSPQVTFDIALNAGDTLTVDMDFQTIVLTTAGSSVGAPRNDVEVAGSTWWNLQPANGPDGIGAANVIEFTTGDSGAVAGTLTVQSADAYSVV